MCVCLNFRMYQIINQCDYLILPMTFIFKVMDVTMCLCIITLCISTAICKTSIDINILIVKPRPESVVMFGFGASLRRSATAFV